jgi:hypothetical protein
MPDSSGALALARLRASRAMPRPDDGRQLRALTTAATRAGRTLVDVRTAGGKPGLGLGWQEGFEPTIDPDRQVVHRHLSTLAMLTFAACLRACWPNRDVDPYPGVAATDEAVLAALAALGTLKDRGLGDEGMAERRRKGALRELRAVGLLEAGRDEVRLGPVVAAWASADVAALRRAWDRLPAAQAPAGSVR